MKKLFLTSLILASAVFAAPAAEKAPATETKPAAEQPKTQEPAKAEVKAEQAPATATPAAQPTQAAQPAEQTAPVTAAPVAEQANAETKPAAEQPKVEEPAKAEVKAEQAPATATPAAQPTQTAQPAEQQKAEPENVVTEVPVEEIIEEEIVYVQKPKKKLIEQDKYSFDVLADFEIQAGKVLWITEDDENGNNLEEWTGKANLATIVESDDFAGKLALEFYPIDNKASKDERDSLSENDYFALTEAWAWQRTKYVNFKLGRWDNTDKHGDYFGGYIDGYLAGFRSTQKSENQIQIGFTPIEYMALNVGLISTGKNLNTGDLRVLFSFQNLPSIERLAVDIGYRSNLFDAVYDSDADIQHNISMKASLPIVKGILTVFAEAALLGLDGEEEVAYVDKNGYKRTRTEEADWHTPITGGFLIETPIVDRIILEAEYVPDREDSPYKTAGKNVKDVLGAVYVEKALTDRFTLSAGVHSFGSTRDWVINGNLVGRIN